MENQNILRIVLSLAILVAFFLPLYNETVFGTALSAWQVLTGGLKDVSDASKLPASQLALVICLGIVLVCMVVILIFSLLRKPTTVLINLLPLLAIIALIVFSTMQAKEDENVGQTLQAFGTGFYIMFLSSFLLPFTSIAVTTPSNG